VGKAMSKEGSISFLKKRTKKLLSIVPFHTGNSSPLYGALIDKSFLVLFFKKEKPFLPFFRARDGADPWRS
jgi:hypothetical protein